MKLSDFNYNLPEELIATKPLEKRDSSNLLVLDRKKGEKKDKKFCQIFNYFNPGDVLVLNDSKVIPARLIGENKTGGRTEVFLNSQILEDTWDGIGRNLKVGDEVGFPNSKLIASIINKDGKIYQIKFNLINKDFWREIEKIGRTPLPPYIQKKLSGVDESFHRNRYQTSYASKKGSVAAPTAGLHFTPELIDKINNKNVNIVYLTLHVGLGTFLPINTEDVKNHKIHKEYFEVSPNDYNLIKEAKKNGKKIFACGTTSLRVLEYLATKEVVTGGLMDNDYAGWTDIFIYPGYKFKIVDALITNFHLPKSSLLLLVSAFAGKEKVFDAYRYAIDRMYRFYSYGDAMLII